MVELFSTISLFKVEPNMFQYKYNFVFLMLPSNAEMINLWKISELYVFLYSPDKCLGGHQIRVTWSMEQMVVCSIRCCPETNYCTFLQLICAGMFYVLPFLYHLTCIHLVGSPDQFGCVKL